MELPPIEIDMPGREDALARINRYVHNITPVMFYRTNDLVHSKRVRWHLEEALEDIITIYGDRFNVDFARTLAEVHDDAEIMTGDVQLHDKERMSTEELEALAKKEGSAIPYSWTDSVRSRTDTTTACCSEPQKTRICWKHNSSHTSISSTAQEKLGTKSGQETTTSYSPQEDATLTTEDTCADSTNSPHATPS